MKTPAIIAVWFAAVSRPALLFVDFNSHVEAIYQAFAHLLVGGLIAAWLMHRACERQVNLVLGEEWVPQCLRPASRRWLVDSAVALTLIEIVCAGLTFIGCCRAATEAIVVPPSTAVVIEQSDEHSIVVKRSK